MQCKHIDIRYSVSDNIIFQALFTDLLVHNYNIRVITVGCPNYLQAIFFKAKRKPVSQNAKKFKRSEILHWHSQKNVQPRTLLLIKKRSSNFSLPSGKNSPPSYKSRTYLVHLNFVFEARKRCENYRPLAAVKVKLVVLGLCLKLYVVFYRFFNVFAPHIPNRYFQNQGFIYS